MGSVIRHSLYCIAGVFIVACIAKRIPGLILAKLWRDKILLARREIREEWSVIYNTT